MIEENSMSDVIKNYIVDRQNKKEVILLKQKFKKDNDGGINQFFIKAIEGLSNYDKDELKIIVKNKKTNKEQTELSFQQDKFQQLKTLAKKCFIDIGTEYQKYLDKIKDDHNFNTWIEANSKNSDKASVATHVAKLTHSSNKGSCFYDRSNPINNSYLTTAHIRNIEPDGAYENAVYSPVASFLLLECNSKYLYEMLLSGDNSALEKFANNTQQLDDWADDFKKALDKPTKSSHNLSKQIYFPVKIKAIKYEDYHLLSVLVSSSLSHEIFNRLGSKEINRFNKEIRGKFKNKEKYSPEILTYYPKKAILKITSSQHQNSSILNGKRSGRMFLLNSQPPVWQSNIKLPINRKQLFYGDFQYQVKDTTKKLKNLIVAIKLNKLSTNKPQNWNKILELTNSIIEKLFEYVSLINKLDKGDSWLENTKLKQSHQLWLDPNREEFKELIKTTNWQQEICEDFASWLANDALKHKKLTLGQEQIEVFKDIFKPQLREFNAIVEAEL